MKAKKRILLLALLLMLLSLAAPAAARRTVCSGDDCGCGTDAQVCVAACAGEPNYAACTRACRIESIACAKACCGGF